MVGVLTEQADYQRARKYWNKLKQRLTEEGSQLVTECHQLKKTAEDGKKRLTDVATAEISREKRTETLEESPKQLILLPIYDIVWEKGERHARVQLFSFVRCAMGQ